jgi:hypothetical protein
VSGVARCWLRLGCVRLRRSLGYFGNLACMHAGLHRCSEEMEMRIRLVRSRCLWSLL